MNLVMSSNHTLDQQQEMAERMFSGVTNQNNPIENLVEEPAYSDKEMGKFVKFVPLKN